MNVLAAGAIIFDAIKEKTHALAERTELQGDKAKNNSERNAVMVRGRQLEELAPALLLPLFFFFFFFFLLCCCCFSFLEPK